MSTFIKTTILSLFLLIPAYSYSDNIPGSLTSNSPCYLSGNEKRCDVTLTAQKRGIPIACIWLTQPELKLFSCGGHDNWTTNWPWTNVSGQTLELRGHVYWPTRDPHWPSSIRAVFEAGIFIDDEIVVAVPDGHTLPNLITQVSEFIFTLNCRATS